MNSGPQFVSAIQIQPGKLNCPGCETFMCVPVLTSIADLQFVLIEFSSELMQGRSQDFLKGGGSHCVKARVLTRLSCRPPRRVSA